MLIKLVLIECAGKTWNIKGAASAQRCSSVKNCAAMLDSGANGTGFGAGIMNTQGILHPQSRPEWSNRILLLSLVGIAYLTLFPFTFNFEVTRVFHKYPFLLGAVEKRSTPLDFFLNVLLFIPFGFGLCARLRKRGASRWTLFLMALAAGAGLSYVVELLQFYIPARDSGWEDVISNTVGSVSGFFLFELCGSAVLKELSKWEDSFEGWLSPQRAALLLACYFMVWFGISVLLQFKTRLSNWDPQCVLFVGNDASGRNPWKGQILLLQIWNRALPEEAIRRIIGQEATGGASSGLLGSYDFRSSPPYADQRNSLPSLEWTPQQPQFKNASAAEFDARSWLSTQHPAEEIAREIKKSNQFTVRIVCAAESTQAANASIVSLSRSAYDVNFQLRQQGANLQIWFREPLADWHSALAWTVRGAFEGRKVRDIVASYDGSDAFLYLDGNRVPQNFRLSPGAGLIHRFLFIRTGALEAYIVVYETLIFLPAGLLIGVATRNKTTSRWKIALAGILPALLLEILLAEVSGRAILASNIALSLVFGLAGMLLINAGRRFKTSLHAS
jgi:glycopeptide antibiotics resistance protein